MKTFNLTQTAPLAQAPVMPFGRYRGIPLQQLSDEYLLWLGCLDNLKQPLLGDVLHEMDRRLAGDEPTLRPDQSAHEVEQ